MECSDQQKEVQAEEGGRRGYRGRRLLIELPGKMLRLLLVQPPPFINTDMRAAAARPGGVGV